MDNYTMGKELWKDVKGYEESYQISNYGRIYSKVRGIIRKQRVTRGYSTIKLTIGSEEKWYSTHRLVALHFIDNPEGKPEVNHIDENKLNNHYTNLMWCTSQENSNWGTRRERISNTLKINSARPFSLKQRPDITLKRIIRTKNKKRTKKNVQHKRVVYKSGVFNSKEVLVLNKNTNEVLDRFISVNAASRVYGLRQNNISDVCAGRAKTTGGYKFKFVS